MEGSDGWMMEEDSFQRRDGGYLNRVCSLSCPQPPENCPVSISFPIAIGPVLLVLTYIVMFPDAKALCEVAS